MRQRRIHHILGWLPVFGLVFTLWGMEVHAEEDPAARTGESREYKLVAAEWFLSPGSHPELYEAIANIANKTAELKEAGTIRDDRLDHVTVLVQKTKAIQEARKGLTEIRRLQQEPNADEEQLSEEAFDLIQAILDTNDYAPFVTVPNRGFSVGMWLNNDHHVIEITPHTVDRDRVMKTCFSAKDGVTTGCAIQNFQDHYDTTLEEAFSLNVTSSAQGDREISYKLDFH